MTKNLFCWLRSWLIIYLRCAMLVERIFTCMQTYNKGPLNVGHISWWKIYVYIPTLEHLGVRDTKLKPFIFRLRLPDSIVAAISLEELFVNHNRQQFQNTRERTEPPLSTSYFSRTHVQPFYCIISHCILVAYLEPMDPLKPTARNLETMTVGRLSVLGVMVCFGCSKLLLLAGSWE